MFEMYNILLDKPDSMFKRQKPYQFYSTVLPDLMQGI